MKDPLDTLPDLSKPLVDLDLRGLYIPSPEVEVEPIWTTPAELGEGKKLIARIEQEIADETSLSAG